MSKKIRILLADDHAVVRQGFRMILGAQADMEIIGEAGNGREAVSMSEQLHPDVVVMDVAMPELDGLETARRICAPDSSRFFTLPVSASLASRKALRITRW